MILTMPSVLNFPRAKPLAIREVIRSSKSSLLPLLTPSLGPIVLITETAAAAMLDISLSSMPTVSFS